MTDTLKKIKEEFKDKFVFESDVFGWIIEKDHAEDIWDYVVKAYSLGIKKGKEEREKEIIGIFKWQFEQALEDGKTTPKEYGGGKDPRVRVKWFLDVFIPSLTHKQKEGK